MLLKLLTFTRFIQIFILEIYTNHQKLNIVDATCGCGNDTLFLCKNFKNSNILSFDIQEEAINNAKKMIDHSNVKFILDSHENIKKYTNSVDLCIFNTGYLPDGDKSITTMPKTTIKAINNTLDILSEKGYIFITVYKSHDNSYESREIDKFIQKLDQNMYIIYNLHNVKNENSPYTYAIYKKN